MSATSDSGLPDADIEAAQSWFVDNFLDGETQLVGGLPTVLTALDASFHVCGGLPLLMTRSSTVKPNGACPDLFTNVNASCTCLSGIDNSDEAWEFHVQLKGNDSGTTTYPLTLAVTDTLQIDVIQTLYVPDTLQKLNLSFNNLTVFPTTPFNVETLQKFYIQGNDISNFTVNASIFERITKLFITISRGGFGLVFTGTYRSRQVAIKKIRLNSDAEASQIEHFIGEITIMATLRHPRIVEFIGVAWDEVVDLSAVTELMECGDLITVLHHCCEGRYRLTWGDHKATIALHIAEALVYLHSLSPVVIHRDLKSKNVLLNTEMEAKLSDFGISCERRTAEAPMAAGMGTSFWIAPEVLRGDDYDEKADMYSFGVVLSELDTDDFPYTNTTNQPGGVLQEGEILQLVANGEMRPTFTPECPSSILQLAHWCLQWKPENRPSAAEVVQLFKG
ncbi:hypothetical protein BBO99_00000690 [Phytophthora kernoviae]|uniref:Protein kinase domain-containing protein n=2 Tax=Phytophthora kernoviae TaxID=325452 RepID=A0A3R7NMB7_9STRA|nr:hypothetical protein G195_008542 [Phytophthora kernoviae 00238/432]KAG2528158.1 hypothetical protein JM16_003024 [Phytophthora kernoviae]KAG2529727.1 hypothetical protein JM18_002708 [Phytophthora kernoviae]RLN44845.1 hypothetical protein BBI17_002829 [Phytophthora kernoviae]RLN85244.1 hypothetical protein BBO99_00000690 [Phytophthora kernoviae]